MLGCYRLMALAPGIECLYRFFSLIRVFIEATDLNRRASARSLSTDSWFSVHEVGRCVRRGLPGREACAWLGFTILAARRRKARMSSVEGQPRPRPGAEGSGEARDNEALQ